MSKGELIDGHVSTSQCKLAVDALHKHALQVQEKREENELLPGKEQHVWLVVAVKTMHPEKKLKPFKIPIAHPLVDPRTTPVCLITKDPQREYKDLLESHGIKFISRVVGITKLKGKFKPFDARRLLLEENGLFLADERVIPLLPGLLGKRFFEAKKQPIPVCLTRKDLKGELERAISSTYMHQNQGTCTSIKIGTLSQKPAQIIDNLKTALPAIVKRIKGEWDNVQSLNVKTNSSVSLPIWTCDLGAGEGGRWDGLVVDEEGGSGEKEGDEDASAGEMDVDAVMQPPTKKGRKRAVDAEEQEDDDVQPKKKSKGSVVARATATGADAKTEKSAKPQPSSDVSKSAAMDAPAKISKTSSVTVEDESHPAPRKTKRSKPVANDDVVSASGSAFRIPGPEASSVVPASDGVDADIESAAEASVKPKRNKKKGRAAFAEALDYNLSTIPASPNQSDAIVDEDPSANTPTHKAKKRKSTKSQISNDASLPTKPGAPGAVPEATAVLGETTPLKSKRKARASAVDFLDADPSTPTTSIPAVPVNTPATPGDNDAVTKKKRRKKSKTDAAEPVDASQLAKALSEAPLTKPSPADKERGVPDADAEMGMNTDSKVPRKARHRKARGLETEVPSTEKAVVSTTIVESGDVDNTGSLTHEEVKTKRKDKKKDKVTKGKPGRSVKEDVIGKKSSLA